VVEQPQVNGNVATVKVDYTQQGSRRADEVRFVVVNGAWLADGITAGLTPTPAPSTSSSTGSATTQGATSQTATTQATTQTSPSTLPDASTGTLVPPPAQFSATMKRAGGSRETGMAVLRGTPDGKTVVVLLMKHAPRGVTQAAEIVHGSCASLGSVAYKLTQVGNGVSNTTLPVALGSFQGPFAAVVHSRGVSSAVASCGDLHRG